MGICPVVTETKISEAGAQTVTSKKKFLTKDRKSVMQEQLKDFEVKLGNRSYAPLMVGGMGVNISNADLVLAVEKLGGIAHLSDALLMEVADKTFGTQLCREKIHKFKETLNRIDKSSIAFNLEHLAQATRRYVGEVMQKATGKGLVFINCMEKLTMNAGLETLKVRLNSALDAGISGITLSAGLHMSSMKLIEDNPRFRDALIGIIVSSTRALQIFLKRAAQVNRMPDYVVVEGPLAGGHLGFGDDWKNFNLADIVRDVKRFLTDNGLKIPVFAAGGIFTGGDAVHYVNDVGADGVQVATRFTIAKECGLPDAVKQTYLNARDDDVEVNHFSTTGYPMRMLKNSPALTSDIRPNCEAYGYLLNKGQCSYIKEWFARREASQNGTESVPHTKCCLCTHMRNFKVWTCGATVSRLKETTVKLADGSWYLPKARQIYEDYLTSTGQAIRVARPL